MTQSFEKTVSPQNALFKTVQVDRSNGSDGGIASENDALVSGGGMGINAESVHGDP